ncbi:MAG: MFS transporter [Limisphaerales bacterium]
MISQRWLRIIPVALVMYTISYVDRTNVSLALDPHISSLMKDLFMDDRMKGQAAGIFFLGYVFLQMPAGYFASRWSPRKLVAIFLVLWGIAATGCGLVTNFHEFAFMRFTLGMAESGVYPTTLVLLANWFPRSERARASAYWNLCQPLAVAGSAPITGWLLGAYGWKTMLIAEGCLPFLWLPIWLYFIRDHPHEVKSISVEERDYIETTLKREAAELEPPMNTPVWHFLLKPSVFVMIGICFLYNCASYGCNAFLTEGLHDPSHSFTGLQTGLLFAVPYVVTGIFMMVNSWHSDKTGERRFHVATVLGISGVSLIASVLMREHSFWLSYALLCFAIPGPFASLALFWAIPIETMPRMAAGAVIGLVNALGNVGGFFGPDIVGRLKMLTHGITIPFSVLGIGLLVAAALCSLLPKGRPQNQPAMPKV